MSEEEDATQKELAEKLPATFLDEDKVLAFAGTMTSRIAAGKKEYPGSYRFDPLEEAKQECVDIAVYAMIEYYRIERLREKLDGLASTKS